MRLTRQWSELKSIEKRGFLFLLMVVFLGSLGAGYLINERGWFEPKVKLLAMFKTGLGLREGTNVMMSGVTVGEVSRIRVLEYENVMVEMKIRKQYAKTIYTDATAQVIRQLAIGEKQINIIPGTQKNSAIENDAIIQGRDSRELVDMLSTGEFGTYLQTFDRMVELLSEISKSLLEKEQENQIANTIDEVYPTLKSIQAMSRNIQQLTPNLDIMSQEVTDLKREVLGTQGMKDLVGTMSDVSPKMKNVLEEMDLALKELTFTLQAMQRSFLFSGGVKELKREQKSKEEGLEPASEEKRRPPR